MTEKEFKEAVKRAVLMALTRDQTIGKTNREILTIVQEKFDGVTYGYLTTILVLLIANNQIYLDGDGYYHLKG